MSKEPRTRTVTSVPIEVWTPWWYRPSLFLLLISIPSLLLFAFSDHSLTLSKARPFYTHKDTIVGIGFLILLAVGSMVGESKKVDQFLYSIGSILRRSTTGRAKPNSSNDRFPELFFTEKFDWGLMAIFLVAHLIFFRGFITNPGLIMGVLGGNLELKHTFETIPGVTTWTQVTMLLAAIRGLRWAGVLPGNITLISPFHFILFGTLFLRAVLWSERLALIEAVVPFFLCALPKVGTLLGRRGKTVLQLLPIFAPPMLLAVFVGFESLRSWQSNSGEYKNVLEFGWKRLFTYYFEAMNTGSAILGVTQFYEGMTFPINEAEYEQLFKGLYQKGILDIEFNNPSGIWYLCVRIGNVLIIPTLLCLGFYLGWIYRFFTKGKLIGLMYPINFMLMMEIIRIYYWPFLNRVTPSTLLLIVILVWATFVSQRIREVST